MGMTDRFRRIPAGLSAPRSRAPARSPRPRLSPTMTRHDDQFLGRGPPAARPQRGALSHRRRGVRLRHLRALARVRRLGQGPHRLRRPRRPVHRRPLGPHPPRPRPRHPRRPRPPQTPGDPHEPRPRPPPAAPLDGRLPRPCPPALRRPPPLRRGRRRRGRGRLGARRRRRRPRPPRRLQRLADHRPRGHEAGRPADRRRAVHGVRRAERGAAGRRSSAAGCWPPPGHWLSATPPAPRPGRRRTPTRRDTGAVRSPPARGPGPRRPPGSRGCRPSRRPP
jgi:hypothetical protein